MTLKLKQLLNRKAAIKKDCDAINEKAAAEGRSTLNEEERARFDKNLAEAKEIDADVKREEDLAEIERSLQPKPDANVEAAKRAAEEKPKSAKVDFAKLQKPKYFHGPDARETAYRAGRWYLANIFGHVPSKAWCEENGMLAQQTATANELGGVLVPDEISTAIIDLRDTYGVFRQESRVIPMGSDSLLIPRSGGGVQAYFVNDTQATTESAKSWSNVQLTAKTLAALVRYPIDLEEDAVISIADDLTREIAWAMAKKEDECGFVGDGTDTYGGIVGVVSRINDGSHAGSIVEAAGGNLKFADLDMADFEAVVGKIPEYAAANAKWYISRQGWAASMQRLMNAAGGTTMTELAAGARPMFLGSPVVTTSVLNSDLAVQASTILALYGDLRLGTTMGSRRQLGISVTRERYWEYRQIGIQGVERMDINVHDVGSNSLAGPIVALKTPAA